MHIPKTGGTSILHELKLQAVDLLEASPALLIHCRNLTPSFHCIAGHIPLFAFDSEDAPRKVLTVLRDPQTRVQSYFNHILSEPHHHGHGFLQKGVITWRELFDQLPYSLECSNLQTRMLGMRPSPACAQMLINGDRYAAEACMGEYFTTELNEAHLEAAAEALERRVEAAVYEIFSFSFNTLLAPLLGNRLVKAPHLRVPAKRIEVDDELASLIARNNRYDACLYDVAREIALKKASELVLSCGNLVKLAGGPFEFSGLHNLEVFEDEPLRWTNGQAQLYLNLPRRLNVIELSVEAWRVGGVDLSEVAVVANGQSIPVEQSDLQTGRVRWTFPVRLANHKYGYGIELKISSGVRSFAGDPRSLGLALHSLTVRS